MTAKQKLEANELKQEMVRKAHCRCQICGCPVTFFTAQLSHRIPKSKEYIKLYGRAVIFHPLNMPVCCADCNSKVLLDPATHPVEASKLVDKIQSQIYLDNNPAHTEFFYAIRDIFGTCRPEFKFCKDRKWRSDFSVPLQKLLIEVEGGVYSQGRHTRGKGYTGDMEKYNEAELLGYHVLRYTPQQVSKCIEDLEKIVKNNA